MKYEFRILIGMCYKLYELFGEKAQSYVNDVASQVGVELMKEMRERSLIKEGAPLPDVLETIIRELDLCDKWKIGKTETGDITIIIEECHVCPKRVGGYQFPATACPIPGVIIGGVKEATGKELLSFKEVTPACTCSIVLYKKAT
jgi:hypothetical protein